MPEDSDHAPGAPAVPDPVSRRIIEELEQDGRRTYAAIGKAVGLSEAAVRQRIQRLLDTGTIRITAMTDPVRMGIRRRATIGARVDGDPAATADRLLDLAEVTAVTVTTGSFDLFVEVSCRDDEHLMELVGHRIRQIPQVRETETFLHLRTRPH
jgi:Lrp/AsnC family transcriptional regulator for asnA, asnC and gidA